MLEIAIFFASLIVSGVAIGVLEDREHARRRREW